MAIKDVRAYIERNGLVETADDDSGKTVYRKPGLDGTTPFPEMEERFGRLIREKRDSHNLNRAQVAMMIGLHEQNLAQYERGQYKLLGTRLIHLAEVLGFSPIEVIHAAAPHLFGQSAEEADDKMQLIMRVLAMPASTTRSLLRLIEELTSEDEPSPPRSRTA
ncbi:MAG TPA: helix-turn-helix transcriptional regulator [Rhizobiaceae bacterium]|nr:helix-turn-helix transcriptional regulator [Rhizobiaceae bacterium]